jgi:hypothetical protein
MLEMEILPDGGVTITGAKADLRRLAQIIDLAAAGGRAEVSFVSDEALTKIVVERHPGE